MNNLEKEYRYENFVADWWAAQAAPKTRLSGCLFTAGLDDCGYPDRTHHPGGTDEIAEGSSSFVIAHRLSTIVNADLIVSLRTAW